MMVTNVKTASGTVYRFTTLDGDDCYVTRDADVPMRAMQGDELANRQIVVGERCQEPTVYVGQSMTIRMHNGDTIWTTPVQQILAVDTYAF
jgi:hypothetical protein